MNSPIIEIKHIEAIGNFLNTYNTDLNYIYHFRRFKEKKLSVDDYCSRKTGSFYSFLNEFRVTRNFNKGSIEQLLMITIKWINGPNPDDVDLFTKNIRDAKLTRDKTMLSLGSKILFLNNPYKIIPKDSLTTNVVGRKIKIVKYQDYIIQVNKFQRDNKPLIDSIINRINDFLSPIELLYSSVLPNIPTIRFNRLTDKLLWTEGQQTGNNSHL